MKKNQPLQRVPADLDGYKVGYISSYTVRMQKDMGTQQGLLIKGNSYYFQARIPVDVLPLFPHGTKPISQEKIGSKTSISLVQAKAIVQDKLSELNERIHLGRTTGSIYKQTISEQDADYLIGKALNFRLKADQETREAGLSAEDWKIHIEPIHADNEAREKAVIARGQLNDDAEAVAQDWLVNHGYDIPQNSPDFRNFAIKFHRAMSVATRATKARSEGNWVETPAEPVAPLRSRHSPAKRKDDTLEALRDYWLTLPAKGGGKKSRTSVAEAETMIRKFKEMVGDMPASSVTEEHVVLLRDKMLAAGSSPATINKGRGILRAIFATAFDSKKLKSNPFSRMKKVPVEDTGATRYYTIAELQAIFNSPVFTQGERPTGGRGEAAFWMPLIGLYTGARLNEIGQLHTEEVSEEEGVPFIHFKHDPGTGRTTKDKKHRKVPIHPDLVRIGFLEYVADLKAKHEKQLFPLLVVTRQDGKAADKWGARWWSSYVKDTVGIERIPKPFHAFRHTFIYNAINSGFPYDHRMRIEGHAMNTVADKSYAKVYPLPLLYETMKKLQFKGLDLGHLKWEQK